MTEVDFGSADMTIAPGGSSSTANGPSGDNAVMDDVTIGDMLVYRMQPSVMTDVTAGHIDFSGNAITPMPWSSPTLTPVDLVSQVVDGSSMLQPLIQTVSTAVVQAALLQTT